MQNTARAKECRAQNDPVSDLEATTTARWVQPKLCRRCATAASPCRPKGSAMPRPNILHMSLCSGTRCDRQVLETELRELVEWTMSQRTMIPRENACQHLFGHYNDWQPVMQTTKSGMKYVMFARCVWLPMPRGCSPDKLLMKSLGRVEAHCGHSCLWIPMPRHHCGHI